MRINSVPDVKCFCNNKNVLRAQSMVWHFVRHPAFCKMNVWAFHRLLCALALIKRNFRFIPVFPAAYYRLCNFYLQYCFKVYCEVMGRRIVIWDINMQRGTGKVFGLHPELPFLPFCDVRFLFVHKRVAKETFHHSITVPNKPRIFFARFYFREFPTHC